MNGSGSTGLRERLEAEAARRNDPAELLPDRPDPLLVAREQGDERAILLCALFGYGNAAAIVAFLNTLDFSLLHADEARIRQRLSNRYYRFQSAEDVVQIFLTLGRLDKGELQEVFMRGYRRDRRVIDGVFELIELFHARNAFESRGYRFLIGSVPKGGRVSSPYKRWMMFLRWMVRHDALDLGRWKGVARSDLVIPLDAHTFRVGHELGLLERKSHDWKAAVELTRALKRFSPEDPVKYDFALYRIGQEGLLKA